MALLLPLLILASSLTSSIASAFLWNFCDANAGNFDNNSTYSSNLNLTRSTLSSSISGFATKIEGNIPNRVYSLVLCRGDTDAFECLSCISTAASIIQKNCTNYKDAVIWYDNCQLRYSNKDFLTAPDITYFKQLINSQLISDDQLQQLETQTTALLTKMTDLAVRDSSHYFATGETALNGTDVVFALVQCARDLPSGDCQWCLQKAMAEITDSLIRWRGGRVLGMWCNMRYELYKFYNGTSLVQQSASSLPPAASSQPPTGGPSNTRSPADSSRGETIKHGNRCYGNHRSCCVWIYLLAILCVWRQRKTSNPRIPRVAKPKEIPDVESILYDLPTILKATSNLSEFMKLGERGFGPIYKGVLPNGKEIAVKRLSTSSRQGHRELRNELALISKLQHKNLVRILGSCLEDEEKLLIYEYMPNKSLDTILFDSTRSKLLDWDKRYKIIGGIARGLLYMHEDSQPKIIHRDLKAGNVLLAANMNPTISDFGTARLFSDDEPKG